MEKIKSKIFLNFNIICNNGQVIELPFYMIEVDSKRIFCSFILFSENEIKMNNIKSNLVDKLTRVSRLEIINVKPGGIGVNIIRNKIFISENNSLTLFNIITNRKGDELIFFEAINESRNNFY